MEKDTEETKVIFRFWKLSQDIIAIFPELCGDSSPYTCQSYEHLGQHSSCDPCGIINNSRPARPDEYEDLKAELENHFGYNLKVIKRNSYTFVDVRRAQLEKVNHG